MDIRTVVDNYKHLFGLLFVLTVGPAIGFGIIGSESVLMGLSAGVFAGTFAFVSVALILLLIILGDYRHVRLLQGLFFGLIAVMIVGNVVTGQTLSDAVIFGFVAGALTFLPIAVLSAILFIAYQIGIQRGEKTTFT